MLEYKVVHHWDDSDDTWEREINALLAEGWVPQGGVSVTYWSHIDQLDDGESPVYLAQAMTREKPCPTKSGSKKTSKTPTAAAPR